MKKLFVAFALVCSSYLAFSQELEFGLKAGLSSDKISLSNISQFEAKVDPNTTLNFGAFGRFKIMLIGLYIQPEIIVNRRASNFTVIDLVGGSSYIFSHSANYVDVPVLVGFKMLKLFRIYAGPNFQFLTSQKTDLPINNINFQSSDLKKKTTGIQFGVGLDLAKLRIDAKYELNAASMGSPFTYKTISPSSTSGMLMLQVGFKMFGLF